jgi:hypothetical protein
VALEQEQPLDVQRRREEHRRRERTPRLRTGAIGFSEYTSPVAAASAANDPAIDTDRLTE